jgi:Helix-turn-helix domain/Bacterial regulatory proteins, gntR family
MTADGKGLPKYARVAAAIRSQVADGTLRPGQPAPSGAALSRVTGYSTLTCRRALRLLIAEGVLTPGPSRNARPRVAGPPQLPAERDLAAAARNLASGLAARRRAKGLTQPELAARAGVSVTTVGHAETGRLWQSRDFWERADTVLGAGGDLLRLHDAYREAGASGASAAPGAPAAAVTSWTAAAAATGQAAPSPPRGPRHGGPAGQGPGQEDQWRLREARGAGGIPAPSPAGPCRRPASGQAAPACVMIVWGDGTVTTVRPPEAAGAQARPAEQARPGEAPWPDAPY